MISARFPGTGKHELALPDVPSSRGSHKGCVYMYTLVPRHNGEDERKEERRKRREARAKFDDSQDG